MKKFLAIYLANQDGDMLEKWESMDEKSRNLRMQEGFNAWQVWAEKNSKFIVEMGGPLGSTMLANKQGTSNTANNMTAYTVIQAESHEAATQIFKNHPHFTIFPGDRIEVMEILPVPTL